MRTETPPTIYLKDYQPAPYLIDHVSLDFRLDAEETRVFARFDMRANPDFAEHGPDSDTPSLVLDGENINLVSITLTGEPVAPADYQVTSDKLILKSPPAEPFTLELETVCNPTSNTALSGLYRSGGNFCTQCEAQGFRRITYFLDQPDILSRYRVRIEGDKTQNPVLLSNGNKVLEGEISDSNRHFAIWEDPFPKPCYLFALVAGDLAKVSDTFTTSSGRQVTLEIFVEHGKQDRCDWAMDCLKRSMVWDEEVFGREYDLDIFMIVAVSDFNMGAMENKGLNVFNDKFILALPDTATDVDYANIEAIIAHEYFHNWSGNRVTCRDWFQLCLKEGLTVFRDQEFSSDVRSRAVKRISDVKLLRAHQFPEDSGPLAHPVRPQSYMEINNFYTATVYEKGAEVVRMLHTLVGKENFRKAMDHYFAHHDGDAATVEDFVQCMAEASGRDLEHFFQWYNEAGTPHVIAEGSYDAAVKTYTLELSQITSPTPGQPTKPPFHIPLVVGLIGPDGRDLPIESRLIELHKAKQTVVFENINARPVLSLNRSFSAPIVLETNMSEKDQLFQMAHDSDSFNQFEAGQEVAMAMIISAMENPDTEPGGLDDFTAALQKVVSDETLEPAFVAQMLTLPGEGTVAGRLAENVDPEAIHMAHRQISALIGKALGDEFNAIMERPAPAPYSPDADAAGLRSLRHTALNFIGAYDKEQGSKLAYKQFTAASNMSDEFGGLVALSQLDTCEREKALDEFYHNHHSDHLLVDKWFALNAQIPFPETLGRVRKLMDHEAFAFNKPNTVRALLGGFAMANPVCFNEIDGSGYELFADAMIKLDQINPQVAARLCGAFRSWRTLETNRAQLAKAALKKINAAPGLSKDTFEITEKSLA
ncbi:Membrane alanine aminopeptidase N [hydrothermal vent metagenome]|uniref:Membrane alanine aminopeptidase N n=1 Tax=hydrothermal vent metagenome TaxID=652676 RepID=A0A3B0S1D4_9ZZZZ